jgi:hypothetical protein
MLTEVVKRANIPVIDRGGSLRFAWEPFQGWPIPGEVLLLEFQSHGALKLDVLGPMDIVDAAAAQPGNNSPQQMASRPRWYHGDSETVALREPVMPIGNSSSG